VLDETSCPASDTILVKRLVHNFDPDVSVDINFVSVDTADEKAIRLAWTVSEKEKVAANQVYIYKRAGSEPWGLHTELSADQTTYVDLNNITDEAIYGYYVGLANRCGEEQRVSSIHNTIQLSGEGDESGNMIKLDWNYYHNWQHGVQKYELWRKKEDESSYAYFTEMHPDANNLMASIATDAFHHNYVIRAIESSGLGESWSNNIEFDFEHAVYVPNIFTPNADSYNQYFEIRNIGLYHDSRLRVVDRWGMTVFETDGYANDWDGGQVPSGVYYYILSLNRNEMQPIKGSLTIVR
jgi:gliding motility-associated-like protein